MAKCIVIQGCKDCPYLQWDGLSGLECFHPETKGVSFNGSTEPPETPHPDCKLNDLPTPEKIKKYAALDTNEFDAKLWESGVEWVINEITK